MDLVLEAPSSSSFGRGQRSMPISSTITQWLTPFGELVQPAWSDLPATIVPEGRRSLAWGLRRLTPQATLCRRYAAGQSRGSGCEVADHVADLSKMVDRPRRACLDGVKQMACYDGDATAPSTPRRLSGSVKQMARYNGDAAAPSPPPRLSGSVVHHPREADGVLLRVMAYDGRRDYRTTPKAGTRDGSQEERYPAQPRPTALGYRPSTRRFWSRSRAAFVKRRRKPCFR